MLQNIKEESREIKGKQRIKTREIYEQKESMRSQKRKKTKDKM